MENELYILMLVVEYGYSSQNIRYSYAGKMIDYPVFSENSFKISVITKSSIKAEALLINVLLMCTLKNHLLMKK